jgi:hypothetical protein
MRGFCAVKRNEKAAKQKERNSEMLPEQPTNSKQNEATLRRGNPQARSAGSFPKMPMV